MVSFTPWGKAVGTHCTGGWVDHRRCEVEKNCHCRESTPSSVPMPTEISRLRTHSNSVVTPFIVFAKDFRESTSLQRPGFVSTVLFTCKILVTVTQTMMMLQRRALPQLTQPSHVYVTCYEWLGHKWHWIHFLVSVRWGHAGRCTLKVIKGHWEQSAVHTSPTSVLGGIVSYAYSLFVAVYKVGHTTLQFL
jgi:hypothetical protein